MPSRRNRAPKNHSRLQEEHAAAPVVADQEQLQQHESDDEQAQKEAAALEQGLAAAAAAAPGDSVDDVMPSSPASPAKEEEETAEEETGNGNKDDDISTIASPSDDNTQCDEEPCAAAAAAAEVPNMSIPPSVASATHAVSEAPTPLKKALAVVAIVRAVFLAAAVWAFIFVLEAMSAAEARFPKQFARARGTIVDVYAKVRDILGFAQEKSLVECVRSLSPHVAVAEAKLVSIDATYANGVVCREVSRAINDAVGEFEKSCPVDARKQLA